MPSKDVPPAHTLNPPQPPAGAPPPDSFGALVPATRLAEFEVERVLGIGGFGIVYLAFDHVLHRHVAIKEYMPSALAGRAADATVTVRAGSHADTFAAGLKSFVNEARLLARFDHPSLVKVHRFWEANGTAYMVMPYYTGRPLHEVRATMTGTPDEALLRRLMDPLLEALELLHRDGVFHRDISPDNILLLPDGSPVLLDFGSARKVIGDRTQALTAVLKPKFAPVEQYADVPGMRQGPWTDLYALGAVMRYLLSGEAPIPAVMRAVRDTMEPLSAPGRAAPPGILPALLAALDWAMQVEPERRPPNVQALRDALDGRITPPPPWQRFTGADVAGDPARPAVDPLTAREWTATASAPAPALPAASAAAMAPSATQAPPAPVGPAQPRRRTWPFAATALVGAACLAGVAAWSVTKDHRPTNATALAAPMAARPASSLPVAPAAVPVTRAPTATAAPQAEPVKADPAPAASRAAAKRPPPQRPSAAGPDPRTQCAGRNFFSRSMCIYDACQEARFRPHAVCVTLRQEQEARRRAEMYR